MEPILGVFAGKLGLWCPARDIVHLTVSMAGYSLDQRTVPEDQLGAYVQEAIDMVSRRATYSRSRLSN